jgi:signal transduction histidine kinase/integral membrane sensor domain MASE1
MPPALLQSTGSPRLADALRPRPLVTAAVLTALGYYVGVQIGLTLTFPPLTTSVLWPPNAILTAALLFVPVRQWWVCLAAALPVHVLPELQAGMAPVTVGLLFLTNCTEALIAAGGMRLFSDAPTEFNTLRRVVVFVAAAGVVAPVLSSFADASAVHFVRGEPYWLVWRIRTFSNIVTELSVVPTVVMLVNLVHRRERLAGPRVVEALFLFGMVGCTAIWIFGGVTDVPGLPRTPSVLLVPFLLWAGVRFGVGGVSVALLLAALTASYESRIGHRPFDLPPMESLLALQSYLAVMAVPVMYIAGLIDERRRGVADLAERLRFEGLLATIAGALVRVPRDVQPSGFDQALQRVGAFFRVDYVGLLETGASGGPLAVVHQWAQPGCTALTGARGVAQFPWVFERVMGGESLVLESIDGLPASATQDREAFQSFGMKTAVVLPLVSGARAHGALSLVTLRPRQWSSEDQAQLRLVAEILANASARWQAEVEVQQTRQELAHLARLSSMGELTASLAHQLNQPLTGILNNAEAARLFLESGRASRDELLALLGEIIEDDQRAGDVIRRVREMLTRTTPPPVPLDANTVVRNVATLVASDAVMRNVSVLFDLSTTPLAITGNRIDLEQALLNVVTNAMEAVGDRPVPGRRVTIATTRDARGRIQIIVRDDGPGFTVGTEQHVFDAFVSGKHDGMGMGLTVARSLVDLHGGSIIAGNDPAGGAIVTMAFPAAADVRE